MANSSYAAQLVANGPMTPPPPGFNGMGWLVAVNLAVMKIATLVGIMVIVKLVGNCMKYCRLDTWLSPASIYRLLGILFACGITLPAALRRLACGDRTRSTRSQSASIWPLCV